MNGCCECGCGIATATGKRFRHGHWAKANRAEIGRQKRVNRRISHGDGYWVVRAEDGKHRLEHVVIAERALGRKLPAGAVVHHLNGERSDNRPQNLAIFPNNAYHQLIHRRMRAMAACGHADWRRCYVCKKWDVPGNLFIPKRGGCIFHNACLNAQRRERKAAA